LQNIDPIWFLQPAAFIGISLGLIFYWRRYRRFSGAALFFSFVAYFTAIALKAVVQLLTINSFEASFGQNNEVALGLYFGVQTVFFEVGLAYVFAHLAMSRTKMWAADAEGYGLGLAFWENGIYVGALLLINLISYYLIFSSLGGTGLAQQLYATLSKAEPSLFYAPLESLPLLGFSILERITSLIFHFSWGLLCIFAAYYKRKKYLFIALPMGLLDFLVPFEPRFGILFFELMIFILALIALGVTLRVTQDIRKQLGNLRELGGESSEERVRGSPHD